MNPYAGTHIVDTEAALAAKQTPIPRELFCRGIRVQRYGIHIGRRCGNTVKYYVFVDEADEARVGICGVCRRKAMRGTLWVTKR